MNAEKILVILGATNTSKGELSTIALERLNACFDLFSEGNLVLCTGGWGDHFNTCEKSHALFAKKYLLKKGIPKANFLPFALSNNTVEDAVKTKEIIQQITFKNLTVITSDYHLERVQLIFNEILKEFTINYFSVKSSLLKKDLEKVTKHEKKSIKKIKENGLYY